MNRIFVQIELPKNQWGKYLAAAKEQRARYLENMEKPLSDYFDQVYLVHEWPDDPSCILLKESTSTIGDAKERLFAEDVKTIDMLIEKYGLATVERSTVILKGYEIGTKPIKGEVK